MYSGWLILRLASSAAIIVYLALSIVPAGRLDGWERRLNDGLFATVVVFAGIRILARYVFHSGLIFQFAVVLAGVAAAIGILVCMKTLIRQQASEKLKSGSGC